MDEFVYLAAASCTPGLPTLQPSRPSRLGPTSFTSCANERLDRYGSKFYTNRKVQSTTVKETRTVCIQCNQSTSIFLPFLVMPQLLQQKFMEQPVMITKHKNEKSLFPNLQSSCCRYLCFLTLENATWPA